jgi:hypothetical protein
MPELAQGSNPDAAEFYSREAQDLEQVREVVHGNPYGMC